MLFIQCLLDYYFASLNTYTKLGNAKSFGVSV